jgi:hypothetical protein
MSRPRSSVQLRDIMHAIYLARAGIWEFTVAKFKSIARVCCWCAASGVLSGRAASDRALGRVETVRPTVRVHCTLEEPSYVCK